KIDHPGKYRATVEFSVQGSAEATSHTAKLVLVGDGKDVQTADRGWDNRRSIQVSTELELPVGEHQFGLRLEPGEPPREGEKALTARVENVTFHGPLDRSHVEYSKEYFQVFVDGPPPAEADARAAYTRKIVRHVA